MISSSSIHISSNFVRETEREGRLSLADKDNLVKLMSKEEDSWKFPKLIKLARNADALYHVLFVNFRLLIRYKIGPNQPKVNKMKLATPKHKYLWAKSC